MTVTVVSCYADLKATLKATKDAKALFLKHGAQDFRLGSDFNWFTGGAIHRFSRSC